MQGILDGYVQSQAVPEPRRQRSKKLGGIVFDKLELVKTRMLFKNVSCVQ